MVGEGVPPGGGGSLGGFGRARLLRSVSFGCSPTASQ